MISIVSNVSGQLRGQIKRRPNVTCILDLKSEILFYFFRFSGLLENLERLFFG